MRDPALRRGRSSIASSRGLWPLPFAHDLPDVELLPSQRQAASLGELVRGGGEVSREQDSDRRAQDRPSQRAVLSNLSPGLVALRYAVESGKTKGAKIHRPVLFGENGTPSVNYEIDAFHDELGIAAEVEAGRGAAGNADYRDIVRTSCTFSGVVRRHLCK